MFKRALLAVAIMGMVAAPATADLVGSLDTIEQAVGLQLKNPDALHGGTIGVLNTLGTFASSNAVFFPAASDVIVITFGLHQPYATPLLIERNRNGIAWDSTEVVILGAGPAGPFITNNIGASPAAGAAAINGLVAPLAGDEQVVGIEQLPAAPFVLNGSSTTPFFRVTIHAVNPVGVDTLLDIFTPEQGTVMGTVMGVSPGGAATTMVTTMITQGVGMIFRTFTTVMGAHTGFTSTPTTIIPGTGLFITGGVATRPSFGGEIRPEPASAALLGMGVLALTGGFWRRRRQA